MHVASTTLFEGPPRPTSSSATTSPRACTWCPASARSCASSPSGQGRPVWVDDPHLNLDYHVRHTALPPPGDEEQLRTSPRASSPSGSTARSRSGSCGWSRASRATASRSSARATTRWSTASPGGHHHGPLRPRARAGPAPGAEPGPRPEPSRAQLLAEALVERLAARARSPAACAPAARAAPRSPPGRRGARRRRRRCRGRASPPPTRRSTSRSARTAASPGSGPTSPTSSGSRTGSAAPSTTSSSRSSPGRSPLPARPGTRPSELDLRAMVPVSVRTADEHGALGNRVSAMMAPLPVWCEDPVERLRMRHATMGDLKASKQAMGATVLTQLTDFAPPRSPARLRACSRASASSTSSSPTSRARSSRSTCSAAGWRRSSRWSPWPSARRSASGS